MSSIRLVTGHSMKRRTLLALAAFVSAGAAALAPTSRAACVGRTLSAESTLLVGQALCAEGHFAVLASNGNFAVHEGAPESVGRTIWETGTGGGEGRYFAVLHHEGNLVIYSGKPGKVRAALWSSNTYSAKGDYLAELRDDGSFAVLRGTPADRGAVLWETTGSGGRPAGEASTPVEQPPGAGAGEGAQASELPLDAEQIAIIVAEHNKPRQAVGAADLTWDPAIARNAQRWADELGRRKSCRDLMETKDAVEHSSKPRGPAGENWGENISWQTRSYRGLQTGAIPLRPVRNLVDQWNKEEEHYDSCKEKCYEKGHPCMERCGHYTQVVWRTNDKVGCGYLTCEYTKEERTRVLGQLLVCQYSPDGNVTGELPF